VKTYALSRAAEDDIDLILRDTKRMFGRQQKNIYRDIIKRGLDMIGMEPDRAGSWDRGYIFPGLRAFHLELAAGKTGAASHCLYYEMTTLPDGLKGASVSRVLHEDMEPKLHIVRTSVYRPPSA
jgi:toxin ParE1/3/4